MNLEAIAKAYTRSIELEEHAEQDAPSLAEEASVLRADLHALWMEALRQAGIPFTDRSDAARIAFDIALGKHKIA
jgi:hypothetical protein